MKKLYQTSSKNARSCEKPITVLKLESLEKRQGQMTETRRPNK